MKTIDIDYLENDFDNLDLIQISLEDLYERTLTKGASKDIIREIEFLTEEEFDRKFPIPHFTETPSLVNQDIALESIVNNIINGLIKIARYIFKLLSNFFNKIADTFKWLAGAGDEDVSTKEEAVIKAIQTGKSEVTNKEITFDNTINKKPVINVVTEKLLKMAYKDNNGNNYKNVKEILDSFFKGGIDDKSWDEIAKNRNPQLSHLCSYTVQWWNSSHPMIVTHGDVVENFVNEIAEIIDFVTNAISLRLKEYMDGINKLAMVSQEEFEDEVGKYQIKLKLAINEIYKEIKEKTNSSFSLIPMIHTKIGEDLQADIKKALEEFKTAKVSPKNKIDLIKSLNKIEWVKDIKGLSINVEKGKKELAITEKQLISIIDNIHGKFFRRNKKVASVINSFLVEMRTETIKLMSINVLLLTFLITIQRHLELNRKKSATLHAFLVSVGVNISKDLKI